MKARLSAPMTDSSIFYSAKNLQRSEFGVQARYSQEDIQTAETDDPDLDNPDASNPLILDTGRVRVGVNRDRAFLPTV